MRQVRILHSMSGDWLRWVRRGNNVNVNCKLGVAHCIDIESRREEARRPRSVASVPIEQDTYGRRAYGQLERLHVELLEAAMELISAEWGSHRESMSKGQRRGNQTSESVPKVRLSRWHSQCACG